MLRYGFDYRGKNYIDIIENIEIMVNDINDELEKLKSNNLTTKVSLSDYISDKVYFEIIYISSAIIEIGAIYKDNGKRYKYPVILKEDHKLEYQFRILTDDNKMVYSIRVFILKPTGEVDEDGCDICDIEDLFFLNTEINEYKKYLSTKVWDEKRREKLKEAGYKCQLCSKKDVKLHVHHNTYERIGDEDMNDLIVLCEDCHKKFHDID